MALCCLLAGVGTGAQALPRVLRVAIGEGIPPYTFSNPPGGVQYDVLNLIIGRMGCQPEILMVPLDRAQSMLQDGSADGILGLTGPYPSQPFIAYQNAAISLKERGLVLKGIADLKTLRVAAFQRARTFLGPEFRAMTEANPDYQEVSPRVVVNQLLFSGRVDVIVSDIHIFEYLNRETRFVDTTQPVTLHPLFPPTRYRMIFNDPDLRDAFDKALKTVLADDPYPALVKKYLTNPSNTDFKP